MSEIKIMTVCELLLQNEEIHKIKKEILEEMTSGGRSIAELMIRDIREHSLKMIAYKELERILYVDKIPTNDDVIKCAKTTISSNSGMKRLKKIACRMRQDGYRITEEFGAYQLKKILMESGEFKINKETKCWEINKK